MDAPTFLAAMKAIGAGLAVIGLIGAGIGIGNVFSSFITAVGRNPSARGDVFTMTMLGFALFAPAPRTAREGGLRARRSHRAVRARHRAHHPVRLEPLLVCRPRESGDPDARHGPGFWIPALAGMTR